MLKIEKYFIKTNLIELFDQSLPMDCSVSFFKYFALLFSLVLYKFMLGVLFLRKDSNNFLWLALPTLCKLEKMFVNYMVSILFLC